MSNGSKRYPRDVFERLKKGAYYRHAHERAWVVKDGNMWSELRANEVRKTVKWSVTSGQMGRE